MVYIEKYKMLWVYKRKKNMFSIYMQMEKVSVTDINHIGWCELCFSGFAYIICHISKAISGLISRRNDKIFSCVYGHISTAIDGIYFTI